MSSQKFNSNLYKLGALSLAPKLIGMELIHTINDQIIGGMIVETESYLATNDPACHAANGITPRNKPMFSKGGISYVYLIYGMHYCFNVVSGDEGNGEAVLIRALEPLYGLEEMKKRRYTHSDHLLTSGPGKLCQALGITKEHNGVSLTEGSLIIRPGKKIPRNKIESSARIGIMEGADLPYRFYVKGSPHVSPGKPEKKNSHRR